MRGCAPSEAGNFYIFATGIVQLGEYFCKFTAGKNKTKQNKTKQTKTKTKTKNITKQNKTKQNKKQLFGPDGLKFCMLGEIFEKKLLESLKFSRFYSKIC